MDARYAPVYLGGWQSSRAFDLRVNNNFATYSARATAEKLTIDRNEIGDARWFDIALTLTPTLTLPLTLSYP